MRDSFAGPSPAHRAPAARPGPRAPRAPCRQLAKAAGFLFSLPSPPGRLDIESVFHVTPPPPVPPPPADTPLTETILSVFNCREIDGVWYLVADMDKECYTTDHMRYFRAGIFWAILLCLGIPIVYLACLIYFRVPLIAKRIILRARLLTLLDEAWTSGVKLPQLDASTLSVNGLPDDVVDALYLEYIDPPPPVTPGAEKSEAIPEEKAEEGAASGGAGSDGSGKKGTGSKQIPQTPVAVVSSALAAHGRDKAAVLPREEKINKLLAYSAVHFSTVHVPWSSAHNDVELDRELSVAAKTIGGIFLEFYASSWYWILVRVRKGGEKSPFCFASAPPKRPSLRAPGRIVCNHARERNAGGSFLAQSRLDRMRLRHHLVLRGRSTNHLAPFCAVLCAG